MPQSSPTLTNDELKVLLQAPQNPPVGTGSDYPGPGGWIPNFGIGVAKGLGQTIEGGGAMLRRYMPFLNNLPEAHLNIDTNPSNYQQKAGAAVEHAGEYGLGAAAVPYAAIPQGLMAAGIAGAHTGGDPGTMLGTGITAAMVPPIISALAKTAPAQAYAMFKAWLASKMPTPPPGAISSGTSLLRGAPGAGAEFTNWRDVTPPKGGLLPGTQPQLPEGVAPPPQGQGQLGTDSTFYQPGNPQGQIGGAPAQGQLPPGPTPPRQLGPGPGAMLPPGTESSVMPDPRLPSRYAQVPGPTAPPATVGGMNLGQEGGIPARGEQTVTGTHLPLSRIPKGEAGAGQFRPLTTEELSQFLQQHGTAGKAPSPEVAPTTPPKKPAAPTPPTKGASGKKSK